LFSSFLQIETLGEGLYTYGAPLLILSSIVLLLSMIAPIFISGKFKHFQ
jgi:NADH-ubiquinone oxidoreductase chain 6